MSGQPGSRNGRKSVESCWSISEYLSSVPGFSAGNHIQFAVKVLVWLLLVYHSPFPIGIELEKGNGWLE
jgi:hypothetical protein